MALRLLESVIIKHLERGSVSKCVSKFYIKNIPGRDAPDLPTDINGPLGTLYFTTKKAPLPPPPLPHFKIRSYVPV